MAQESAARARIITVIVYFSFIRSKLSERKSVPRIKAATLWSWWVKWRLSVVTGNKQWTCLTKLTDRLKVAVRQVCSGWAKTKLRIQKSRLHSNNTVWVSVWAVNSSFYSLGKVSISCSAALKHHCFKANQPFNLITF